MKLSGEQRFVSPRGVVWETLLSPDVLEECIPGAQSVEQVSEDLYEGSVKRGLASVTVTMDVSVMIEEDDRPERMQATIEGTDNRINSTVNGEAFVRIDEEDGGAVLVYDADLHFTGKLASLGGRLIKPAMNKDLKEFFSSVESYLAKQ